MSFWVDGEELSDEVVDNEEEYRYVITERDGMVTFVYVEKGSLIDLDDRLLFHDEDGTVIMFYTESEAVDWLNKNIKADLIDPNYVKEDKSRFYK